MRIAEYERKITELERKVGQLTTEVRRGELAASYRGAEL